MKYQPTFSEWKNAVNYILLQIRGFTVEDLPPDYCYYDAWKAGDTPQQAAADALENAKDY